MGLRKPEPFVGQGPPPPHLSIVSIPFFNQSPPPLPLPLNYREVNLLCEVALELNELYGGRMVVW